jgi:hypothetical protein
MCAQTHRTCSYHRVAICEEHQPHRDWGRSGDDWFVVDPIDSEEEVLS